MTFTRLVGAGDLQVSREYCVSIPPANDCSTIHLVCKTVEGRRESCFGHDRSDEISCAAHTICDLRWRVKVTDSQLKPQLKRRLLNTEFRRLLANVGKATFANLHSQLQLYANLL